MSTQRRLSEGRDSFFSPSSAAPIPLSRPFDNRKRGGSYALVCTLTDYDAWREGSEPVTVEEVMRVLKTNADVSKHIDASILGAVHEAVSSKQVGTQAQGGMKFGCMTPHKEVDPEELYKLKYLLPAYFGQYEDPVRARSTFRPTTRSSLVPPPPSADSPRLPPFLSSPLGPSNTTFAPPGARSPSRQAHRHPFNVPLLIARSAGSSRLTVPPEKLPFSFSLRFTLARMLVLSKILALASLASRSAARPGLSPRSEQTAVRGDSRLPEDYNPYDGGKKAPEVNFPSGLSRDIAARKIHSHNDYWRETPLYSALSHGVLSVEADVWLNPKDGKLYVSHNVASLTKARTFKHLYVDQLVDVLERANLQDEETEFFDQTDYYSQTNEREVPRARYAPFFDGSSESIQLLVDIKSQGLDTFEVIMKELEPLRERDWLTKWNGTHIVPGPVKIILTGNGNNPEVRALVAPKQKRDYFIDAPLFRLNETWTGVDGQEYGWNSTLSPLASASYNSLTTWTGRQPINETEEARVQAVIDEVHAGGFETRFWSPPRWPVFAREEIWKTLLQLGSDWLDADDIADAAAF